MKRKFVLGFILVGVFSIMLLGLWKIVTKKEVSQQGDKISIVTSFYPLYYFASEIGGERADVKNITPSGVEPHDYEPTARDVVDIQKSKLLILNGGGFEAWAEKIKEDLKNSGVEVAEAGEGLFVNNDPHIWLSPELAKNMVKTILVAMIQNDPKNESYYTANMVNLIGKLEKLQTDYKNGLSVCVKKEIVVSHDAFSYLTQEFGLTQIAISGLSPDEEPSTKELAEVAKLASEKRVKYIFFETLVSPKLAETVAEEIGAKTLVLDPLEGVEESRQATENYFTIMEDNLSNLKTALECQ